MPNENKLAEQIGSILNPTITTHIEHYSIFDDEKSFGEPPLIGDFKYPASAAATKKSILLKLPKENFVALLRAHPNIHLQFNKKWQQLENRASLRPARITARPPEGERNSQVDNT